MNLRNNKMRLLAVLGSVFWFLYIVKAIISGTLYEYGIFIGVFQMMFLIINITALLDIKTSKRSNINQTKNSEDENE